MTRLVWARKDGRGLAHMIVLGFARPSHGHFGEDDEYNTICDAVVVAHQTVQPEEPRTGWKHCQKCLSELGRCIEQTMPEE